MENDLTFNFYDRYIRQRKTKNRIQKKIKKAGGKLMHANEKYQCPGAALIDTLSAGVFVELFE